MMATLVEDLKETALRQLEPGDRDLLTRVYVYRQTPVQICADLSLTDTQFRLLKARAENRFRRLEEGFPMVAAKGLGEAVGLDQLVPLVAHAVAVFGDEDKASHWLTASLPILGNQAPVEALTNQGGLALIEQILTRIEHNIPS